MKKMIIMLSLLFMFVYHQQVQASEPIAKVESEDWEITLFETDYSIDKNMTKCEDNCSNFTITTKNKKGTKYDVMTMITFEGGSVADYGYQKATGFFKDTKEVLHSDEILTDFTNYPVSKKKDSIEVLFTWSDQDQLYKETLIVPIDSHK
ncbi:hypothetical protein [Alkalicoccobacillus plakortidis]|uniref:DUF4352 domain-containing protein n=1 Tax=Alkalicoccobacillus plakortidis TaxID=444060 RepID=A0ABT0XLN2_9BACI|nr:hypothetical protein [Alkalicoccobacillus plakortidis]MCM2676811.1 hypothetical protein [Alkalicoccobacillus plakortidis]